MDTFLQTAAAIFSITPGGSNTSMMVAGESMIVIGAIVICFSLSRKGFLKVANPEEVAVAGLCLVSTGVSIFTIGAFT